LPEWKAALYAPPAELTGGTVSHRLREKSELRATFTGLFIIDGASRLAVFLVTGLLLHPGLLLACFGTLLPGSGVGEPGDRGAERNCTITPNTT
jgi:hypothetical protein